MTEPPGLAGDLLGIALLANGVDLVVARPADAESARQDPIAVALAHPVGLPGEHRLVEGEAARLDDHAVGDELVAGLDPHDVARARPRRRVARRAVPSRITFAFGATSNASRSRVSFAFSSWRIPIALLMIAITPNSASANSPSDRISTKKPAMIALKSVKTLPATMLATERLVVCSRAQPREPLRGLGA